MQNNPHSIENNDSYQATLSGRNDSSISGEYSFFPTERRYEPYMYERYPHNVVPRKKKIIVVSGWKLAME